MNCQQRHHDLALRRWAVVLISASCSLIIMCEQRRCPREPCSRGLSRVQSAGALLSAAQFRDQYNHVCVHEDRKDAGTACGLALNVMAAAVLLCQRGAPKQC